MTAWSHVQYSSDRTQATVEIRSITKDPKLQLKYLFDGAVSPSPTKNFTTSKTGPLTVSVLGSDGSRIDLEPVDFVWNAPVIQQTAGDYRKGQKGSIVEMFGWPHADIAAECAAIASYGYLGVKTFPAQEQVMSDQPFNNILNPWYFMYQPVSYRLQGRMGTRDQLRSMIQTCRQLNVRVYSDAVVNHMVGCGNDANPKHRNDNNGACTTWPNKNSSLVGGSSPFYSQCFAYTTAIDTGMPPMQEFPAVGYGPLDFHCERALNSWTDPLDLNAGWLTGLVDLNTERDNVRERIADYMTDLIGIGYSGFRIDAAKHIKPDDLVAILMKLRRNLGGHFPDDFITWLEILLGGEADMLMCNVNSGYNYGGYLTSALLSAGMSQDDVDKVKIWNSGYPKEPEKGDCTISKTRNAVQNDDADQQNPGSSSRDMGNEGCVLVRGCAVDVHRAFEVKLFQDPNGVDDNDNDFPIRLVLSSFYFPSDNAMGIPDGLSECSRCTITCQGCLDVPYQKAFDAGSTGYNNPGYTRVHRDQAIVQAMRKWMHLS